MSQIPPAPRSLVVPVGASEVIDLEDDSTLLTTPGSHDPVMVPDRSEGAGQAFLGGDYWAAPAYSPGSWYGQPVGLLGGPFTARGEYLLWWTRGSHVPPLVTTGALGAAGTSILFGDSSLTSGARSGGRVVLDFWGGNDPYTGIQAVYFGTGEETDTFRAASAGVPTLARPFFNITTGAEDAHRVAYNDPAVPESTEGAVTIDATTELHGVEVLLRRVFTQNGPLQMDVTLGWRFNRLDDGLLLSSESTILVNPVILPGTTFDVFDRFDTRNDFHGAQLGVTLKERYWRWSMETAVKLALGSTRSRVWIDGATTKTVPPLPPVTYAGGLLALPTNTGVYEDDHFTVIPELGVTLKYDLTPRLQATFGYTFIYWSKVARPGDQIDRDVNLSQVNGGALVGAPRPAFSWVTTDFWAQGMNFGLEYRY